MTLLRQRVGPDTEAIVGRGGQQLAHSTDRRRIGDLMAHGTKKEHSLPQVKEAQ